MVTLRGGTLSHPCGIMIDMNHYEYENSIFDNDKYEPFGFTTDGYGWDCLPDPWPRDPDGMDDADRAYYEAR